LSLKKRPPKSRLGKLTLNPLSLEKALEGAMKIKPPVEKKSLKVKRGKAKGEKRIRPCGVST